MQKVDVMGFKAREREKVRVECEEHGQAFEFELHELTTLEEISAGEMADECEEEYQGGFPIDGKHADVSRRAWGMACRLFLMQEVMAYSVEEFIHLFFKFPLVTSKLAEVLAGKPDAKKKGPRESGSSQSASKEESDTPP